MRLTRISLMLAVTAAALMVPATAAHATYPGPNGLIVFASDTGGGFQLYTVRPSGLAEHQITQVTGNAIKPDWSPDGSRIVFEFDDPSGTCSIQLVNPDGSGIVDLTGQRSDCENDPSFAPSGRRVVFVRSTSNHEAIWSMDLTGGNRHRITPAPPGLHARDPNVSPDGTMLSFVAEGAAGRHALFTVRMNGSDVTQILPPSFDMSTKQDWAPDGSKIVFTDYANTTDVPGNIATIRPRGSGLHYLTHFKSSSMRAGTGSYSPDGRWIVFRLQVGDRYGLYRMRSDGGARQRILPLSSFYPSGSDWGPAPTG